MPKFVEQYDEEEEDDEIIVVPYTKPPPPLIILDLHESDQEQSQHEPEHDESEQSSTRNEDNIPTSCVSSEGDEVTVISVVPSPNKQNLADRRHEEQESMNGNGNTDNIQENVHVNSKIEDDEEDCIVIEPEVSNNNKENNRNIASSSMAMNLTSELSEPKMPTSTLIYNLSAPLKRKLSPAREFYQFLPSNTDEVQVPSNNNNPFKRPRHHEEVLQQQPVVVEQFPPGILPSQWTLPMIHYYTTQTSMRYLDYIYHQQEADYRFWEHDEHLYKPRNNYSSRRNYILCKRCNQRGHSYYKCTEKPKGPICAICGKHNKHITQDCPKTLCLNCGANCKRFVRICSHCSKKVKLNCSVCGAQGHLSRKCPNQWRIFHATTKGKANNDNSEAPPFVEPETRRPVKYVPKSESFCANCGRRGHNYFKCKVQRTGYFPHQPKIIMASSSNQDQPVPVVVEPSVQEQPELPEEDRDNTTTTNLLNRFVVTLAKEEQDVLLNHLEMTTIEEFLDQFDTNANAKSVLKVINGQLIFDFSTFAQREKKKRPYLLQFLLRTLQDPNNVQLLEKFLNQKGLLMNTVTTPQTRKEIRAQVKALKPTAAATAKAKFNHKNINSKNSKKVTKIKHKILQGKKPGHLEERLRNTKKGKATKGMYNKFKDKLRHLNATTTNSPKQQQQEPKHKKAKNNRVKIWKEQLKHKSQSSSSSSSKKQKKSTKNSKAGSSDQQQLHQQNQKSPSTRPRRYFQLDIS